MDTEILDSDDNRISFYPKWAILLFSTFGSVLFGSILMAINISNTENKKNIPSTIIFSLFYSVICAKIISTIGFPMIYSVIGLNFIAGLILIFPIWNHNLGIYPNFQSRPIWIPLFIFVLTLTAFILLNIFASQNNA